MRIIIQMTGWCEHNHLFFVDGLLVCIRSILCLPDLNEAFQISRGGAGLQEGKHIN